MNAAVPLAVAWTDILNQRFLDNTPLQWLGLLGILLGSLVVGKIISFIIQRQADRLGQVEKLNALSMLLKSARRPAGMLVLAGGLYLAVGVGVIRVPQESQKFWLQVCEAIAVLAAGWFIYRLVDIVELFLVRWTGKTETTLDDQLVPLVRKSMRVLVVIVAALFIAQNVFRWDIGALIAGLGIGGLAFALAAKDMLANLFGSVTIFADRPFHMGDRVKVGGYEGTVEEVGFRSTRIRTLTGHLVTLPNAMLANEPVENVTRRPFIKRTLQISVTYDTPPEKIRRAIEIVREMLDARTEHFADDKPARVFFGDFAAASLDLVIYYWYVPPEWWDYLAFNHDFNMELLRRFNEEQIEFAFPTQTLYVKQDSPFVADIRHGGDEGQPLRGAYT